MNSNNKENKTELGTTTTMMMMMMTTTTITEMIITNTLSLLFINWFIEKKRIFE